MSQSSHGVVLAVVVQPRASRTRVVGEHGGMLKVQLAAPPVDGEANAELVRFLAGCLGVPRASVELLSGETSRRKRVLLRGATIESITHALGEASK